MATRKAATATKAPAKTTATAPNPFNTGALAALANPAAGTAAPVLVAANAPANAVPHPTLKYTHPKAAQAAQVLKLGSKPYSVKAAHNQAMWVQVQAALAAGNGQATWAAICAQGVPAHFIGYAVRRGTLAVVAAQAA